MILLSTGVITLVLGVAGLGGTLIGWALAQMSARMRRIEGQMDAIYRAFIPQEIPAPRPV